MEWLLNLRSEKIPVNGLLLKENASDFTKELLPNLQALSSFSDGWLEKWKKCNLFLVFIFTTTSMSLMCPLTLWCIFLSSKP